MFRREEPAMPEVEEVDNVESRVFDPNSTSSYLGKWNWVKLVLLILWWLTFTLFLIVNEEKKHNEMMVAVNPDNGKNFSVKQPYYDNIAGLTLKGPFMLASSDRRDHYDLKNVDDPSLIVVAQLVTLDKNGEPVATKDISDAWRIKLVDSQNFDEAEILSRSNIFMLTENVQVSSSSKLQFHFSTNVPRTIPVFLFYDDSPIEYHIGFTWFVLILFLLYILLFCDLINRTMAMILSSSLAVGVLALYRCRPTLATLLTFIDFDYLMMIFAMSLIMAVVADTGVIEYIAVEAYGLSNGHIWPLIYCMWIFNSITSAVLDNVVQMMIMIPLTIRICEVMNLNPLAMVRCLTIFSILNDSLIPYAGQLTRVIMNVNCIVQSEIGFGVYFLHLAPGILLTLIFAFTYLRILYIDSSKMTYDTSEAERLEHVIHLLEGTALGMSAYTKEEEETRTQLQNKIALLRKRVKRLGKMPTPVKDFHDNLADLRAKYPIKNKILLIKCIIALAFVTILPKLTLLSFFANVTLGWIVMLGAFLLIIVDDIEDIESLLTRINWSMLWFFAALYVLVRSFDVLGVTRRLSMRYETILLNVSDSTTRTYVGTLLMLWTSALASCVLGNIPVAAELTKVICELAFDTQLGLTIKPLFWAIVYGCYIGGTGTIIASSTTIVAVGILERSGYHLGFLRYFKVGFPIMIGNLIIISIYLYIILEVIE